MLSHPGFKPREFDLDATGLSEVKFGKEMREKEFFLRQDTIFLNHGSYGAVPRRLLDIQTKYIWEREKHPDLWFRINAKYYIDKTRQAVADFVGADVENVLLVSNATTALNIAVKSYPFQADDAILDTNVSYGSVKNLTADFTSRMRPDVKSVQLQLDFPIESEDCIVHKYQEILDKHPEIKMVILDHITSPTSILMPVKRLVDVCHQHGAIVIIDGAHTIGQIPLNLKEIGANIYTSNMHKWVYAPKGSAFLWFDNKHAHWISPLNTSWLIGLSLEKQFFDQGTNDHVPCICAAQALEFYSAIGGVDKIVGYTSELAERAKEIFVNEVGLHALEIPKCLESPNMKLVKLPAFPKYPCSQENAWVLQKALFGDNNIFAIIYLVSETYYIRYSIQVYNDIDEIKVVAKVIKDFIEKNV